MNQRVAARIAERIAELDGVPYPPEHLKTIRQQIAAEELDRYEAERWHKKFSTGLPEQWSEEIPNYNVSFTNAVAIARGHRLG